MKHRGIMEQVKVGKIYSAINAIQTKLNKTGITKSHKNQSQGYNFRGIDDVYNILSPLMASEGVCIMPRMLARTVTERQTQKGGMLFSVCVEAEFDFVSSEDGSRHMVKTFGEAMDSGDKATNKAMSAAYKYACFQTFAIPVSGENDGDAKTYKPKAEAKPLSEGYVKTAKDAMAVFNTDALEVLIGVPSEVTERNVKNKKGDIVPAWDIVIDDTRVSTLDEGQGMLAIKGRDNNRALAIGYKIKGNFKNALYVKWEVPDSDGNRFPDSQTDPEPIMSSSDSF